VRYLNYPYSDAHAETMARWLPLSLADDVRELLESQRPDTGGARKLANVLEAMRYRALIIDELKP
jgi:hypothetical protein